MAEQRIFEMAGAHEMQSERSPFRSILPGEPKQGGDQSDVFFSPHEACRPGIMRARAALQWIIRPERSPALSPGCPPA